MPPNVNELILKNWLKKDCSLNNFKLEPLANDASFRRYYRVYADCYRFIVMLAPTDKEDIVSFLAIAKNFIKQGIHVPKILSYNLEQGFILLSDLGRALYFEILNTENVKELYTLALHVIPQMQACHPQLEGGQSLNFFDKEFIHNELDLFVDWFLGRHLKLDTCLIKLSLEDTFRLLTDSVLEQPTVCVHRDYHSRNLLLINNREVGVLDFQDAVYGPITYDAVSLLRDAYIDWPDSEVEKLKLDFYDILRKNYCFPKSEFFRWFDLTGLQRHLKILGIFARLCYRDNKPLYLENTPRLLNYLQKICAKYSELKSLTELLNSIVSNIPTKPKIK